MTANELAQSMMICIYSSKNGCDGCMMHGTEDYESFMCRKRLHERASQLLVDMANDIRTLGGCTMCMHYEECKKDAKGSDIILCEDFAYPEEGYRKYNLMKGAAKRGRKAEYQ